MTKQDAFLILRKRMNKSKYRKLLGEHELNKIHSITVTFSFPKKNNVLLNVMRNNNTAKAIPVAFSTLVNSICKIYNICE